MPDDHMEENDHSQEPSTEELEELFKALEEDEEEGEGSEEGASLSSDAPSSEPSPVQEPTTSSYMEEPDMSVATFFESWSLFGDAALSGALAGALLGTLGVYIILKRMVFLSAALAQSASLGIVLAFFMQGAMGWSGVHPLLGAGVTTFGALLVLSSRKIQHPSLRDSALGVVYLTGAAGTLLLGTRIVQELHDVQTILFGSAVAVVPDDFHMLLVVTIVLGAIHVVGWRGFTAVVLDAEDAQIRGLPVRQIELVLLLTLAMGVALSTSILGALPTFAFSVLPAMIALRLVANVQRALVLAAIFGAAMGFLGYLLAFLYELPVGASQAIVGIALVFLGAAFRMGVALFEAPRTRRRTSSPR